MELNELSIKRLRTCENALYMLALEAAKNSPYEFIVTCGHRSVEDQQKLYAKGRTEPGKKVTNCDGVIYKSKHNYKPSKAFDIAVKINGKISWAVKYYKIVGAHFKAVADVLGIDISWGGDWTKFPDFPHIQLKD